MRTCPNSQRTRTKPENEVNKGVIWILCEGKLLIWERLVLSISRMSLLRSRKLGTIYGNNSVYVTGSQPLYMVCNRWVTGILKKVLIMTILVFLCSRRTSSWEYFKQWPQRWAVGEGTWGQCRLVRELMLGSYPSDAHLSHICLVIFPDSTDRKEGLFLTVQVPAIRPARISHHILLQDLNRDWYGLYESSFSISNLDKIVMSEEVEIMKLPKMFHQSFER